MALVKDSLSPDSIDIADSAEQASDVIRRLCDHVAGVLKMEREPIERAILDRERARTTAFANGAAVPHCRLPKLSRFAIGLTVLRQPVRWDNEGHAVDTIMMIVGPAENVADHLRILANSSQLLDSPALRLKLRQAPDPAAAYELISAAEDVVEQRRSQDGMLRELRGAQANGGAQDHLADVAARFDW